MPQEQAPDLQAKMCDDVGEVLGDAQNVEQALGAWLMGASVRQAGIDVCVEYDVDPNLETVEVIVYAGVRGWDYGEGDSFCYPCTGFEEGSTWYFDEFKENKEKAKEEIKEYIVENWLYDLLEHEINEKEARKELTRSEIESLENFREEVDEDVLREKLEQLTEKIVDKILEAVDYCINQ